MRYHTKHSTGMALLWTYISVATSTATISVARLSEEKKIKTHWALPSGLSAKPEGLSIRSVAEMVAKSAATMEKEAWSFMYMLLSSSGLSRRNHATDIQGPLRMRLKSSRVGGVTCAIVVATQGAECGAPVFGASSA